MAEYLIFFQLIGTTSNQEYIYQLDFSQDPESAWGNGWAECPASNVRNISPEEDFVSSCYQITTPLLFSTANRNNCFSMQDCIDDIIPLAFCIDGEDVIIFNFSNLKEDVLEELTRLQIPYKELQRVVKEGTKTSVEKLVDNLNSDDE